VFLLVGSVLAGCSKPDVGRLPANASQPANIILIVADALRADRLGAYGSKGELTPTMDAIAREGTLFQRTIAAAPWTQPSVASLFSACYPGVHQVRSYQVAFDSTFSGDPKVAVFGDTFQTLAEALHAGGYETAAFSANPFVIADYGFGQGFDHFDASFASFADTNRRGAVLNAALFDWLAQRDSRKPLFLYLHYMDVHGPYEGDPAYLEQRMVELESSSNLHAMTEYETRALMHLRRPPKYAKDLARHARLMGYREYWIARYDAGVRQMDKHLAALRQRLSDLGLWDNSLVVVTADHGEALCEHHIWDHGLSVHDNQLHVPLILHWPGVVPAGKRVAATTRLIDVMPTLLDQMRLPAVAGVQGRSLLPHVRSDEPLPGAVAYAECVKSGTEQKAVYDGNRKLLLVESSPPQAVWFNLADDPREQNPLVDQVALRSLLDLAARQAKENAAGASAHAATQVELSDDERSRLESLGYLHTNEPAETSSP
jgi:arylsulfatase